MIPTELFIRYWNQVVLMVSPPEVIMQGDRDLISIRSPRLIDVTVLSANSSICLTYGWVVMVCVAACATDAAGQQVNFKRDIEPVFQARCAKCHGPRKQES